MIWIFCAVALFFFNWTNAQVAKSTFSCEGRSTGYYADVGSGCQVYHMCDGLGRQFSYTCPNATLFQQRMLICDHWYMVNCSKSESDYSANLRIGQREMPFVDDSESSPYRRTPRPDLLRHPSESELNIIYRTGRIQSGSNLNNLVGAESDDNDGSESASSSTDEPPAYSLPSHWSTEYTQQQPTTNKPFVSNNKKITTSTIKGKPIIPSIGVDNNVIVNFKSQFKATTPVYPKSVESTSPNPNDAGLLPPLPYQLAKKQEKEPPTTTERVAVNFESNFKATTPVYPLHVEATSVDPFSSGVLAPLAPGETPTAPESSKSDEQLPSLSLDFEPPAVDTNFRPGDHKEQEPVVKPSIFYQVPKLEPDYKEVDRKNEVGESSNTQSKRDGDLKALRGEDWIKLRRKFFIPDYDFPLESVSRPSYDSVLNSFQADGSGSQRSA